MGETVDTRIPPPVKKKLAAYCTKHGITRTEAIVRALDVYLNNEIDGANPYSLAADLIPAKGAKALQSDCLRILARRAVLRTHVR